MDFVPMWPAPFQKKSLCWSKTYHFWPKVFSGPETDFVSKKTTKTNKLRINKLYNKMCLTIPSLFSRYDFCFCMFAYF